MSAVPAASRVWDVLGDRRNRMMTTARLGGLAAVLWAVGNQSVPRLAGGDFTVPLLMALSAVGWLGWLASRRLLGDDRAVWASLLLLAGAGGALAAYVPVAITMVAVAGLGAGIAFETSKAWTVGAAGALVLVIAVAALGTPSPGEVMAEGVLSAVAGVMIGGSRRQYLSRVAQAEALLAERVRADTERDRAAALAERNRLGREIHDVLAHSLGALSVQLDAADALLEEGSDPAKARELVRQARGLAVAGLEETRQAVHALRDEPIELSEQLAALAQHDDAELTVTGVPRGLGPDAAHAIYRAAQEGLSNARKHAPGAPVRLHLDFGLDRTQLVVSNRAADGSAHAHGAGHLAGSGGGFGLRGMRERIELLGGHMRAEPDDGGWTVEVVVPA